MTDIKHCPFQRQKNQLFLFHPEFLTELQKEVLSDNIQEIDWTQKQLYSPEISRNILRLLYQTNKIPTVQNPEQVIHHVIQFFSLTDDWKLANFLLPNGQLINGSINHHIRDIDHREVRDILEQTEQKAYSQVNSLTAFLNTGTLRISQTEDCLYLETQTKLTRKQQEMLNHHIRKHNLMLQADVSSPSGNILTSINCMWSIEIQEFFQNCNQFFDLFEILKPPIK